MRKASPELPFQFHQPQGPMAAPGLQQHRPLSSEAAGGEPGRLGAPEAFRTLPGPLVTSEDLTTLLPGLEPGIRKMGGEPSCELGLASLRENRSFRTSPKGGVESAVSGSGATRPRCPQGPAGSSEARAGARAGDHGCSPRAPKGQALGTPGWVLTSEGLQSGGQGSTGN